MRCHKLSLGLNVHQLPQSAVVPRTPDCQAFSRATSSAGKPQHSHGASTEAVCDAPQSAKHSKTRQQSSAALRQAVAKHGRHQFRQEAPHTKLTRQQTSRQKQQQQQQVQPQLVMAPFAGQQGPLEFNGVIRYAQTYRQAKAWLDELLSLADTSPQPIIVGCDTETPATFVRGQHKKTSLLQLCYHAGRQEPVCLLLPLYRLGIPSPLLRLLSHSNVIKVGVDVAADVFVLQRDYAALANIDIKGLFDLNWLAGACHTPRPPSVAKLQAMQQAQQQGAKLQDWKEHWGLAGLLEHMSEFSLAKSKSVQCSNWGRQPLTQKQVEYAAADAYAGLVVYHSLWLKWLQVLQLHEQLQEQHPQDHAEGIGSTEVIAAAAGSSDVDKHQDVLKLLLDEVIEGSSWDHAAEVATALTCTKQEHRGGELQPAAVGPGGDISSLQHRQLQQQDQQCKQQAIQKPSGSDSATMQYTLSIRQLTSQNFWQGYKPAHSNTASRRWEKEVFRPGLAATKRLMQRCRTNSVIKLEIIVLYLAWQINWVCSAKGTARG